MAKPPTPASRPWIREPVTERDLSWLDWSVPVDLSADGKTLLFSEEGDGGGSDYSVYIRDTRGSPAVRLGAGRPLSLSRDGKWVLITNVHQLPEQLVLVPTGVGGPQTLTHDAIDHFRAWFFPDGNRILIDGSEPGHSRRGYMLEIGSPTTNPRAVTPEGVQPLMNDPISPDGKFFIARNMRGNKVSLYSAAGGQPKPIEGIGPGDCTAGWTTDGQSVYVFKVADPPAKVMRVEISTEKKVTWKELVPPDPAGVHHFPLVRVTLDGKAYVYEYVRNLSDLYLVDGLK
jgi:hypothetical protein